MPDSCIPENSANRKIRDRTPILSRCRFHGPRRAVMVLVCVFGSAASLLSLIALALGEPSGPTWRTWSFLGAGVALAFFCAGGIWHVSQGTVHAKWTAARQIHKLRENEKNLRKVFDAIHAGIVIIDAQDHTIVDVNSTAADMIGAPVEEIVGSVCHKCICPTEQGQCPISDLQQKIDNSERVLLTASGERVSILKTVVPVLFNGRRHYLESFIDITDRKHTENMLRIQRDFSAAVGAVENLHDALELCLTTTLEISGMDRGAIYLANKSGGLDLAAQRGISPAMLKNIVYFGPGVPHLAPLRDAEPVYYPGQVIPDNLASAVDREGLAHAAFLPVHHDEQLIACLFVASRGPKSLSVWKRHELEACAAHASETIGRLLAEEAVRGSQKNLQALFDTIDEFAFVLDCDGRFLHFNHWFMERLGYPPGELWGTQIFQLHPRENQKDILAALSRMTKDSSVSTAIPFLARDGSLTPVETTFSRGKWSGQDVVFGMARDITERKRAEAQQQRHAQALEAANGALTKAYRAAEAANEAKNAFLANMSHELRTPLHSILSFSSFGRNKCPVTDREQLGEFFELIHRSGETLLTVVDDLLDLATLEAGKIPLAPREVDLYELCLQVADELHSQAFERGLVIRCPEPACETLVDADPNQLHQVVRNILGNAVKFSPNGGEIDIGLWREDRSFFVSVRDQGMGIPEDELGSIFEKFFQSSRTSTGAGGTGLGLAICREIMTAHGGRVWAENRPEGGAVVTLEIPLDLKDARKGNHGPVKKALRVPS